MSGRKRTQRCGERLLECRTSKTRQPSAWTGSQSSLFLSDAGTETDDMQYGARNMTASRRTKFVITSMAMFCVVATVGPANATPNVSGDDHAFAKEMAENNAAEVAAANLALKLTERGDIRNFAQDVLDERAATEAQLRAVASQDGLNLSFEPTAAA